MSTDLNSEFTHFNLVIRSSKAKQSAFRLCTVFGDSRCSGCPLRPFEECIPYRVKPFRTARNFIFYYCSSRFWSSTWHVRQQATGMSFSCRCGLFGIWWGETCCAPNSLELESRFMPIGARLDHGPGAGNNRTTFRFRNWILFLINCFGFPVCHQLVPHLVPNFPACLSVMCRGV